MTLPVVLKPLAQADLISAEDWCESRGVGLGADFRKWVGEALARVRQNPELYGREYKDIRIAPMRRHNHAVAYRIETTQITVVAVYHVSSHPRVWKSRA